MMGLCKQGIEAPEPPSLQPVDSFKPSGHTCAPGRMGPPVRFWGSAPEQCKPTWELCAVALAFIPKPKPCMSCGLAIATTSRAATCQTTASACPTWRTSTARQALDRTSRGGPRGRLGSDWPRSVDGQGGYQNADKTGDAEDEAVIRCPPKRHGVTDAYLDQRVAVCRVPFEGLHVLVVVL